MICGRMRCASQPAVRSTRMGNGWMQRFKPRPRRNLKKSSCPRRGIYAAAQSAADRPPSGDIDIRSEYAKALQRSEEHTSELQSLMRISYAVFCLKKKQKHNIADPTRIERKYDEIVNNNHAIVTPNCKNLGDHHNGHTMKMHTCTLHCT